MTITGFIKGQTLKISQSVIVESSIDYLEAQFTFQTSDWDDLDKWAHFTNGGTSYVLRLKKDKIGRDMHLNLFAGTWKVYLHGTGKNGMRITTDEAALTVRTTGAENGEVFPTIPPSVAEQVALDARAARDIAEELRADAENGMFDGTSVTISSISESIEDGGLNTVVFSDGSSLNVKNGSRGSTGDKGDAGEKGEKGEKGERGADGLTPHIGTNGNWWIGETDTGVSVAPDVVQTTGDSETKVMSQKAVTELVGDLYDTDIPVGEIIDGHYLTPLGAVDDSSTSCVTDFIEVAEGFTLKIKNCYLEGNRSICGYDENKKFALLFAKESSQTEVAFAVPEGVHYIRITGRAGIAPSVEKIDCPINTELALLGKHIDSVDESVSGIFENEIVPFHTVSGKMVISTGRLDVDSSSTSYFIKVLGGKTVILSGVNAEYSRAIVLYDENGNFKECIATNQFVYDFTIDVEETSYIGFVALDGNFSAKYKDFGIIKDEYIDFDKQAEKYAENEYIGNYLPARRKIAESTIESGYLTAIGTVIADINYRHTPFIEIEGGRDFIVTNLTPTANIALIFLDGRKNIIGTVPHEYTGVAMEMEFTAPRNAAYIRFSLLKADADRVFVTYKEPLERNAHEKSILDGWFNDSFHKITTLFGDYVKQPLITIIDDDTVDVGQVQTFKDVCDANGIKGTYACITEVATGHPELAELLHAVEQEGFHVCLHCRTHTNNPNIFSEPYFDPVAAEANIVQGCKDMLELGFADWRFWVTPGGESFPALQNLVRKWGFECVVTSDTNREIETTEAKRGRWYISRPSWLSTADDVDDGDALISSNNHLTLKGWKAKADEVAATGGWLLVNTHMYGEEQYGWADPNSKTRRDFAAFVEYAKSIGCTFTTLNEAWRIKEPIYRFYELFM